MQMRLTPFILAALAFLSFWPLAEPPQAPMKPNAITPCRSSASRNTAPTSRISIGSIPMPRKAARVRQWADGTFDTLNPVF